MKFYFAFLACTLIFSGCGELAPRTEKQEKKQTTAEKLKPSTENNLEMLMEKSGHNINYILYGLLNFDEVKVKRGTQNIIQICRLMIQNLPDDVMADVDEKERWESTYKKQSEIAENLNYRFEEANYDATRMEIINLLENCMSCHKEITGIPKADLTFVGTRDPAMELSLTQVMDSCNINFDDLLFGLIAHDMDELATAIKNIKRTSALIMHKIPSQHQSKKDKWDAYCKDQIKIAEEVGEKIKANQEDEIWNTVERLLKVCMDCHKLCKPAAWT